MASLLRRPIRRRPPDVDRESTPIVLFSSCVSPQETGDHVYNGGVKLYNLWVKLLRQHGYPAFVVTYDGGYEPWLIEHQPHVSLATVRSWRDAGLPLRFATSWLRAQAFIDLADELYFFDAEMAYTAGDHLPLLERLLKRKIKAIATHSRTQQAWYMGRFGREPALIPIWSDDSYWRSTPERRIGNLIGYMAESGESGAEIELMSQRCESAGVGASFVEVQGDEHEVLATLQQCDIFLGLNRGKHPLWGEGSPLPQQEAMHAGAVVAAYDVHGNREYLIDGFSGLIAPCGQPEALAVRLVDLLRDPDLKERLRENGSRLAAKAFTPALRWPLLRDFLDLEELGASPPLGADSLWRRETLEEALGAPVYLGEEEVPAFAGYAAAAAGTIVELGAAYGGSTLLFNMAAPDAYEIVSVDPFVPDSMNGFRASPSDCWRNVHRGARVLGSPARLARWTLRIQASHELSPAWDRPIGLLFIDGDHTYEAVRRDFDEWSPFVRLGGTILLHDSRRLPGGPDAEFNRGWPGPTRLAAELADHACVRLADEVFSTTVWQKTDDLCAICGAVEGAA